jgi:alpha-L-rhamnosidase
MRTVPLLLAPITALAMASSAHAQLDVQRLRAEYRVDPIAVADSKPRLSWIVDSGRNNQRQTAYRIVVSSTPEKLSRGEADLWDSGKVASDETLHIRYGGKPVGFAQTAFWKVMAWDQDGKASRWSKPARWGVGPSTEAEWSPSTWIAGAAKAAESAPKLTPEGAQWIWHGPEAKAPKAGKRWFRTSFDLPADAALKSAWMVVSADDNHETRINGQTVARGTSWQTIQVVDVAKQLKPGRNQLRIVAENGGADPAGVVAKLVVEFAGKTVEIQTSPDWESADTSSGPWTKAGSVGAYGTAPWGIGRADSASAMEPVAQFRKDFRIEKPVRKAVLYATALGLYEFTLNGKRVGDDALAPGWTEYRKRTYYHAYDVTKHLRGGANAVGALLGDGWYSGYLAFSGRRNYYGSEPKLRATLLIEHTDGTRSLVGTDGTWKTAPGEIQHADMLMGTAVDFRKQTGGWDRAGFDDSSWKPARATVAEGVLVQPHPGSAVRPQEVLRARRLLTPKPGVFVYDFAQNVTGVVRLNVRGKAGQTVVLRHAEFLDKDGGIYTANLRAAKATDSFVLAGSGTTRCEPKFTFHGFQYVEVTGLDSPPALSDVEAVVLHSDLEKAGTFDSDNPLLNRLALNTDWGQRGNYLDVPTDCPQRDERAGWTGDAQVFTKAAAFNRDIGAFTTKWLVDLIEDAQRADGALPDVAPYISVVGHGNAAWEDAGVICTYRMYEMYGDTSVIERHWAALTKFMDHLEAVSPGGLRPVGAYGDWLRLDGPQHGRVLGTAYHVFDCRLMARMARAIGRPDDAAKYEARAARIKDAFIQAFVTPDGRVEENGTTGQTFYALALAWDLLPAELRPAATGHLVRLIRARGEHLATGFIGTPVLLYALRESGQAALADRLLLSETFPSWLYQVKIGATTMWERWDGWTPEKGFQDAGMNSFNHYWLGCVTEYLQTAVAGIDTDGPGFRKLVLRPETDSRLGRASATYESIRGTVKSSWSKAVDGTLVWNVRIPANATARVEIPASAGAAIVQNGKPLAGGIRRGDRTIVDVGSGDWRFEVRP